MGETHVNLEGVVRTQVYCDNGEAILGAMQSKAKLGKTLEIRGI